MASQNNKSAIGVFDSGIGGLTVARELFRVLPNERVVYLGDTARVPYGNKSKETVVKFSTESVLFLMDQKVKLVVVACNTASSFALPALRKFSSTPVLGVIDPGVEAALQATRSGRIGVIGTTSTIGSGAYQKGIKRRAPKAQVVSVSCPLFVPFAEEGWVSDKIIESVAHKYLAPLKSSKIDTLILGCTHYPLLKNTIAKVMGEKVRLVDSATQTALKASLLLKKLNQLNTARRSGHRFFVTDEPKQFSKLSKRFLGKSIGQVQRA